MPKKQILLATAAALVPGLAHAHTGNAASSFQAGLLHPLTGGDHLLAIVGFGILAGSLGGMASRLLPASFLLAMIGGALAGAAGLAIQGVEPMILASVIVLGLLVGFAVRPDVRVLAGMALLFGAVHGLAHGAEAPSFGMSGFIAGFALTTMALLASGVFLRRELNPLHLAITGAALSVLGIGMAM